MKMLMSSRNMAEVGLLKGVLEERGIRSDLRNEQVGQVYAGIPAFYPELWVHDEDFDRAEALVKEWQAPGPLSEPWTCANCGESVDGGLTDCWSCGAPRPGAESAALA